jgi:hypothetical protein
MDLDRDTSFDEPSQSSVSRLDCSLQWAANYEIDILSDGEVFEELGEFVTLLKAKFSEGRVAQFPIHGSILY